MKWILIINKCFLFRVNENVFIKCSCSVDLGKETNSRSTCPLQEKSRTCLLACHPGTFHNVLFLLTMHPRAMVLKLEYTLESPKPLVINADLEAPASEICYLVVN